MNKKETIGKLEKQLSELTGQFEKLKNTDQKIPKLEMDRMLSGIRASYELFTVWNYLNTYGENDDLQEEQAIPVVQNFIPEKQPEIQVEKVEEKAPEPIIQAPKTQPVPDKKEVIREKSQEILTTTLADKFHQSKIDNLKTAIPLHEKFLFINELFGGDNGPYNTFIDSVNHAQDMEQAANLLAESAIRYNWDIENKTYLKLQTLVLRRHA